MFYSCCSILNSNLYCNTLTSPLVRTFTRGDKFFELSNHLGNVLVTITDKKLQHTANNTAVDFYLPDVISTQDYYPFGMQMPGRKYSSASYMYGFNGKEYDKETGYIDYGGRMYDDNGRFISIDPLTKKYPWLSPYQFAGNTPIWATDLDCLEPVVFTDNLDYQKSKHSRYGYDIYTTNDLKDGSNVILMNRPNTNKWYYLKNQSDEKYAQFFTDAPGNKMAKTVYWQRFETAEQQSARVASESADMLAKGAFAIFAIGVAVPTASAGLTAYGAHALAASTSSRVIGAGVNAGFQYLGNVANYGWEKNNLRNINITSVALSTFNPSANSLSIGINAGISNFGKWTTDDKFNNAIGGNQFNFGTAISGAAIDYFGGKIGNSISGFSTKFDGFSSIQSEVIGNVLGGTVSTPANFINENINKPNNSITAQQ